jgi:hypothetical protein
MSEVRLYLNGELVDVDPKTEIIETKQINSLFELKDRQTSFTNNFTVLLTNETSRILDRLGDTYNTSIKPYRTLTPQVYRGGTPTITDGRFVIKRVDKRKKIKGSIQSGIVDFFDAIGGESLSSLNYTGVSHVFNEATVLSSFSNEWSDGYIYSISDYGLTDATEIDFRYQAPSLFIKWIWEQIFIDAGFTYSYRGAENPLDSLGFKSKILTLNKGFISSTDADPPELKLECNGIDTIVEDGRKYIRMIEVLDPDNYHSISESPNNNESLIMVTSNNYFQITLDGTINNGAQIVVELDDNTFLITASGVFSESIFVYLSVNSKIKIYSTGANYSYNFIFKMFRNNNQSVINFNSYLSNVKKKDFFKAVLQTYGLMFQREKGTNNYEFIRVEDLFLDRANSQNLSNKLYSADTETSKFGSYGQVNRLTYNYDESGASYSDGSFFIDDNTLKEDANLLRVPFKAAKLTGSVFNSELLYETTLFSVTRNDDGSIKEVKPKNTIPYIMNVLKKDGNLDYTFDGVGSSNFSGTLPISNFTGLNFNILIADHYSSFVRTMNRTKVHSVKMELTANDVYQFDFLKLVYLDQLQRYFYCNKIKSYKENSLTKMELIEVNTSRQTTGEYSDDYSIDYNI